ncbi:type II toxin-antitoxin system Phd/YefM family antitoxin [Nocardia sp. NPDC059180]|uniref:type II toxin-antitoxin system Phd/YefM family antitoxin n=1 Tax=Nocardia sp. NPDC059180 TaxID=3346761 RepID=UPI0036BC574F
MNVDVRDLRDHLDRHLAAVRSGTPLMVTDHGRPIARIVPVDQQTPRKAGRVSAARTLKGPAPEPIQGIGIASDLIDDQRL